MSAVGTLLVLAFAERVDYVTQTNPATFITWAQLFSIGLVLGGVYALIALGYTLVYGILFMINFAHGEVMMLGAYCGYFAMQFVIMDGQHSFEDGAALISTIILPLIVGVVFLAPRRAAATNQPNESLQRSTIRNFVIMPGRFLIGLLIGYSILVALSNGAPHMYLIVVTTLGVLFVVVCGMLFSMLVAFLLERTAYRPLRKAPRLVPLISAIGASIFLQQVALRIFGPGRKAYEQPQLLDTPPNFFINLGTLGVLPVNKVGVFIVILSILLMIMLYIIVQRTKIGTAMRAVAEDKDTAALMGINVDRVIVFTFLLGAALAGAAGVMLGLRGDDLNARFGFTPGLKAFTAAVLGGIGNIPGAMFGGFFLGIVESLGPQMLGLNNDWKNAIAFSLLVIVIIFRPTGILGELTGAKKV
ncbi:MAG: branched-chain amino acid ABC transporter permease [Anaerolineae bacterium]|nr:branched-chain amino acid ABC transporter permease [Anaerolineae bacterium]